MLSCVFSLTELFRALADPTRLRIVQLARRMELTVGELAQVLDQSQPRVSRHVKILCDARLLERHKEGSWVFVRASGGAAASRVGALLDLGEEPAADMERLEAVRAERVAAAERYFADHAADWDSIRRLHVADTKVEAAILQLLGQRSVGRLLDVGTGTGRILELLADRAEEATGIDRSAEMLRAARGKLEHAGLGDCPVRQGDMASLPLPAESVDTVVLHHVLHFAEHPPAAVKEAVRVLAPGGRLLIADFAPHEREELRRDHAHVRLGFADNAVAAWMRQSGLQPAEPVHLEGGPLTVTLWLGEKQRESARRAA